MGLVCLFLVQILLAITGMLTLLHISDLHFGPPYLPRVGQALLRGAPQLNANVIVVSGDLTQRAKREQAFVFATFAISRD